MGGKSLTVNQRSLGKSFTAIYKLTPGNSIDQPLRSYIHWSFTRYSLFLSFILVYISSDAQANTFTSYQLNQSNQSIQPHQQVYWPPKQMNPSARLSDSLRKNVNRPTSRALNLGYIYLKNGEFVEAEKWVFDFIHFILIDVSLFSPLFISLPGFSLLPYY